MDISVKTIEICRNYLNQKNIGTKPEKIKCVRRVLQIEVSANFFKYLARTLTK
jgi:hypothetical protein